MNKEITVKSEKIFEGKIINLRVDTVELENQKYAKREIVEHRGAVAVLAFNEAGEALLVKQYRKPVEDFTLEIPAGKLEVSEEPMECALRELEEETGYKAGSIEFIAEILSSPGFSNEKIFLYKAGDLKASTPHFDEDEFIEITSVSKADVMQKIKSKAIKDGKTLVALLYWLNS